MKMNFLKSTYGAMMLVGLLAVSCNRDEDMQQGTDTEEEQAVETSSEGDDSADDALEMAYQGEHQLTVSGGRVKYNMCATVTNDKEHHIITIDFGDGCVGPYGRERKGKILIAYSSEVGDSLANRIITFENFFVNNKGVTGTIELRDVSINADDNLQSTNRLKDLTITFPNGQKVVYNGSRTREWLAGAGDDDPTNNKYKITGTVTGESTTGRSFTQEIVEPIISDWSCAAQGNFARVSGVVELTKLNGYSVRKRTVYYGDGVCDNVITITTFRRTYSVTIGS
ncbi:hypothetical protein D4L85_09900 [Chryseolinea soli]|uniref:Lipoprotein n=2 Tax=Chryseolinea soli TaxID=2321403 RepID=A0A385SN47_9BACT|nr:hypothetical protein D4L85_09900 [Chryseolinea soli]